MSNNPNGTELNENALWYHDPDTGAFFDIDDNELGFYFHPKDLLFIASNGMEIRFRDFNPQTMIDSQQRFENQYMPQIPKIKVDIGDGDYDLQSNPNDAAYKADLDKYHIKLALFITSLQLSFGLDVKVPPKEKWDEDFADIIEMSFDENEPMLKHHIKRKYIEWQLNKKHEYTILVQLVQGRKMPTVSEVRKELERFPADGQ